MSITMRKPIRISSWSSARSTRVVIARRSRRPAAGAELHAPAPIRARAGVEPAAVHGRSLVHPAKAAPASAGERPRTVRAADLRARVGHVKLDRALLAAQREMRAGRARRVLERVRQRLLRDPKDGQLNAVGQLARIAVERPSSRECRRRGPARARRRGGRGRVVARAAANRPARPRGARRAAVASRSSAWRPVAETRCGGLRSRVAAMTPSRTSRRRRGRSSR